MGKQGFLTAEKANKQKQLKLLSKIFSLVFSSKLELAGVVV